MIISFQMCNSAAFCPTRRIRNQSAERRRAERRKHLDESARYRPCRKADDLETVGVKNWTHLGEQEHSPLPPACCPGWHERTRKRDEGEREEKVGIGETEVQIAWNSGCRQVTPSWESSWLDRGQHRAGVTSVQNWSACLQAPKDGPLMGERGRRGKRQRWRSRKTETEREK